jgi:acylphosphatase
MTAASLFAVVHGRVQGVGYRYFVLRQATLRGLTGYARNLEDGTVEVYAEGVRARLEELCSELEHGSAPASVTRVDARYGAARGGYGGFSVG